MLQNSNDNIIVNDRTYNVNQSEQKIENDRSENVNQHRDDAALCPSQKIFIDLAD